MSDRTIWAGRAPAILIIALLFFSGSSAWADSMTLAWNASPSPAVAGYQVYYGLASGDYDGYVDAGGGTNVTISGLSPGTTYYLAVRAYDAAGDESFFSNEITNNSSMVPEITGGLLDQTVLTGGTATLTVSAASTLPLAYQWFHGATAVAGATNTALTVANVSDATAGNYTVVVANSAGSVTSGVAVISVIDPPLITSEPALLQIVSAGSSVSLSVTVSGTPPFTFQWYDGTAAIPTGTKETLNLANVTAANTGIYYAVVQNAAGSVSSTIASLTVMPALLPAVSIGAPAAAGDFAPVAGAYNGLFYQTNDGNPEVTEQTAGMLANCVVDTNGVYSARIRLGGFRYSMGGTFDASGNDSEIVSRAASGLADLNVTLHLDMTGETQMMSGAVSSVDAGNPWSASLLADLATNSQIVPTGSFDMVLAPGGPDSLDGSGNIWISSDASGTVTLFGSLSDGTVLSQTDSLSQDGTMPLYFNLYGGLGLLEGWVNLTNGAPSGTLTWIRPSGVTVGGVVLPGITNLLNMGAGQ